MYSHRAADAERPDRPHAAAGAEHRAVEGKVHLVRPLRIRSDAEEILLRVLAPRRPAFGEQVAVRELGKDRARFDRPVLFQGTGGPHIQGAVMA